MSDGPRKPPPLPARASPRAPPPDVPPPALPAPGQQVSRALKEHITEMALGLLEEQVQARIVHYKVDLETNPELDAITAQVVDQLREIQAATRPSMEISTNREAIRASHERILRGLLERVFRSDAPSLLVERRLREIHRKLARLFFQSELHDKTRGQEGTTKVIQHGEQAIYYVLKRYDHRLHNELGGFDYASDEIRERALELLTKITKEMQDSFLSRRSMQLKRIVSAFHGMLLDFFATHLAPRVGDMAREVIDQAATWEPRAYPYKVAAEAFGNFRVAFERCFMTRLVGYAEDELVKRLADTAGAARGEMIQFITDPHIFSMICGDISDALYEFLCNEGFLDLPPDWRHAPAQPTA
jgi:hypothetical protein